MAAITERGLNLAEEMTKNRVQEIEALRKVYEEYLRLKGLNPENFRQINGVGRLLSDEEMEKLVSK